MFSINNPFSSDVSLNINFVDGKSPYETERNDKDQVFEDKHQKVIQYYWDSREYYLEFILVIPRMQKFSAFVLTHNDTRIFNINLQNQ